jgi:hypothetical protein
MALGFREEHEMRYQAREIGGDKPYAVMDMKLGLWTKNLSDQMDRYGTKRGAEKRAQILNGWEVQRKAVRERDKLRPAARDAIISAIVAEALRQEESGAAELAAAIRYEGTTIAKKFGLSHVPGLPDTYPTKEETEA